MKTIEKDSITSKDKLIEKAIKEISDGTFKDSFSFVRGVCAVTEDWNVEAINGNWMNISSVQHMIYASRVHQSSRHQIDFVLAMFAGKMKTKMQATTKVAAELETEEPVDSDDEYLSVICMSKESITVECYDIIASTYKGVTSRVISPTPTHIQQEEENVKIILADALLTNYFKMTRGQELSCRKIISGYDGTFADDKQRFPEKSHFIHLRDDLMVDTAAVVEPPKKMNKFGY